MFQLDAKKKKNFAISKPSENLHIAFLGKKQREKLKYIIIF